MTLYCEIVSKVALQTISQSWTTSWEKGQYGFISSREYMDSMFQTQRETSGGAFYKLEHLPAR